VTTAANGTASVTVPATTTGFARAQFPGSDAYTSSVSREVSTSAATVLKGATWSRKGLKATLRTTGGAAAAGVVVRLQKRVGSRWKSVSTATTDKTGVVKVKIKVRTRTVFRFLSAATPAYRSDASPNVTLKP
jgi:hypothetical protein